MTTGTYQGLPAVPSAGLLPPQAVLNRLVQPGGPLAPVLGAGVPF